MWVPAEPERGNGEGRPPQANRRAATRRRRATPRPGQKHRPRVGGPTNGRCWVSLEVAMAPEDTGAKPDLSNRISGSL